MSTVNKDELLQAIRRDLKDEYGTFESTLSGLAPETFATPTPAAGWTVADQIGHLAYFDDLAVLSMTDPTAFGEHLAQLTDAEHDIRRHLELGRSRSPADLLAWWQGGRDRLLDAAAGLDPAARLVWFGPPMSAASFLTARLMETWAHGQDVADALGLLRTATGRLRHVAHLGVVTRSFSYVARGLEAPAGEVFVGLDAPDGSRWEWGSPASADRVEGDALDFCLVVTQRRHPQRHPFANRRTSGRRVDEHRPGLRRSGRRRAAAGAVPALAPALAPAARPYTVVVAAAMHPPVALTRTALRRRTRIMRFGLPKLTLGATVAALGLLGVAVAGAGASGSHAVARAGAGQRVALAAPYEYLGWGDPQPPANVISAAVAWTHVGISSMNGDTDETDETVSIADLQQILAFARTNHLARLTYWAVNRDRSCTAGLSLAAGDCSGINQSAYAFTDLVASYTG